MNEPASSVDLRPHAGGGYAFGSWFGFGWKGSCGTCLAVPARDLPGRRSVQQGAEAFPTARSHQVAARIRTADTPPQLELKGCRSELPARQAACSWLPFCSSARCRQRKVRYSLPFAGSIRAKPNVSGPVERISPGGQSVSCFSGCPHVHKLAGVPQPRDARTGCPSRGRGRKQSAALSTASG